MDSEWLAGRPDEGRDPHVIRSGSIAFEWAPGTATPNTPHWMASANYFSETSSKAPSIAICATINGYNYTAIIRREGGIDLSQPGEGANKRRKKSVHIANLQPLIMFLDMAEKQAREYYGPDWGKAGDGDE